MFALGSSLDLIQLQINTQNIGERKERVPGKGRGGGLVEVEVIQTLITEGRRGSE
jgi:hypothetical protein